MSDYRNGYGDAKADLLRMISEAMQLIDRNTDGCELSEPSPEQERELRARWAALRQTRAMVKGLKPRRK